MNNRDKRVLTIIVLICFISMSICVYFDQKASADALTIGMIGGAAIAIGSVWGLNLVFGNGSTSDNVVQYIENQINRYIGDRTLTEVFGTEIVRSVAGKLVIPSMLANGILNFLLDLCSVNSIDPVDGGSGFQYVFVDGTPVLSFYNTDYNSVLRKQVPFSPSGSVSANGFTLIITPSGNIYNADIYFQGTKIYSTNSVGLATYWLQKYNTKVECIKRSPNGAQSIYELGDYSQYFESSVYVSVDEGTIFYNELSENEDINITNNLQEWGADTNLEDMLSDIFDDAADNNLYVDGEIVEPAPAPTPAPTFEPWPTHAPVDDVIDGLNDLLNQGEISIHNQGVISSAAERAAEAAEEATAAIEDALDIPTEEEIPLYKFDLRTLFPFCIPFDIYNLLQAFDGVAAAPHFQIPIVIQSIGFSYTMDLDFSAFNTVAAVLRQVELIAFAIALAFATSKVIRW